MARELPKHRDAFYIYFKNLEDGMTHTKAVQATAEEIGVHERTIFRWHKKFGWEERTLRKQAAIAHEMEIKSTKDFAENRLKYLNILHKILDSFVKEGVPLEIESTKDLDLIIKNCLVLQERPTEIQQNYNETNIGFNNLFDDELLDEILKEDKIN